MTNMGQRLKPIEGLHATRYMLIMVVAFALTVIVTRLYLELTGYPQLGNETFHFAHALWGGLLQIIAATLMLLYLNEWVFSLSATLAGIGTGLFIDEIGKFITQTNDYFFPLAAPIIYITILLGVLLYLFVSQKDEHDAHGDFYIILDELKLVIDQRMDKHHYSEMMERLDRLADQSDRDDLATLADALRQSLPDENEFTADPIDTPLRRLTILWEDFEDRYFSQPVIRRLLMVFFFIIGALSLLESVVLSAIVVDSDNLQSLILIGIMQSNPLITSPNSLNWYIALMVVVAVVGILYLIAFGAFFRQRDHFAIRAGSIGLIVSLTVGNTMSFYFNQFSVMLSSVVSFVLLLMLLRYRDRFLMVDA